MDKRKEDSPLISFTVTLNGDSCKSITLRNIGKSVKRIKFFRVMGDRRLQVSCYAEPNKLKTCLQEEGKRVRLVHWQCGEARTEGYPKISFTVHVGVDYKEWTMVQKKLLKKIIVQRAHGFQVLKTDNGWDISGCSEPNTLLNFLQEAGNTTVHLVHWRECATKLCQNPSFVNYIDNKSNGYNANSQPRATYMQSSTPRDKPYANKAGICSCCIM